MTKLLKSLYPKKYILFIYLQLHFIASQYCSKSVHKCSFAIKKTVIYWTIILHVMTVSFFTFYNSHWFSHGCINFFLYVQQVPTPPKNGMVVVPKAGSMHLKFCAKFF